ncbi:MAG: hypothetical protein K2L49_05515, partial [Muribaculaceae bacterium]|nr:hypothetical protein [Muribaculaceae bacterium]
TCQGGLCACRASGMMDRADDCADHALRDLLSFINERWKGMAPVCWGETLVEGQFMSWLYDGVCGLDMVAGSDEKIGMMVHEIEKRAV